MADVFLSYARDDRKLAAGLAQRLEEAGFSVWWDRYIDGGADFGAEIEREIHAAGSVVVLWSRSSQASKWVRDEAAYGRDEDKLVPLCIDVTPPPLGFRQIQALDFSQWTGTVDSEAFAALLRSLRRMLERRAVTRPPMPASSSATTAPSPSPTYAASSRRWGVLAAIAAVVLAVLVAAVAYLRSPPAAGPRGVVQGEFEIRPFTANPPDADRAARAATYADAFRNRLTELGVRNVPAAASDSAAPKSEFILVGEVARAGDKEVLTARIDDRSTGATLWTIRQPPSEGALAEANLAGYAVQCALQRRDRGRGTDLMSRYLYGCASFLEGNFREFYAAAKAAHDAAPDDPRAIAFYAVGTVAVGYGDAVSRADHERYLKQARDLAERALRLEPKNADAMLAMGFTFDDPQFADQEKWWRAAVEADPGSGIAPGRYGNFLAAVGRIREAMDMQLRAAQMRRNWRVTRTARLFAAAGDWRQAAALYDLTRPLDPAGVAASELQTYVMYGDLDTAARMLRERAEAAGRDLGCWKLLLRARRHEPYDRTAFAEQCGQRFESASLYAIAGDVDGAYREIENLIDAEDSFEAPHLFGPEMAPLRRDARFWPLAARLGFTAYWLETGHWPDFCKAPDNLVDCRKAARQVQAALPAKQGVHER